jgi:hypothetical protein
MMSPLRAITLAALTVGVLDGLDAIIFFGPRRRAPFRRGAPLPVVVNGVLIHIFWVGIPAAFIIRMTSRA